MTALDKRLKRVYVPHSAAMVALRRVEPLIHDVGFLFNRDWLDRVLLSAYLQGLMDGETVWAAVFDRQLPETEQVLGEEWPG